MKSPIVSWLSSPVRLTFDSVEHINEKHSQCSAHVGEVHVLTVHRLFTQLDDAAKRKLLKRLHREWRAAHLRLAKITQAIVLVLLHERYAGTSRYRPPGTWTSNLMWRRMRKELSSDDAAYAERLMSNLAREGLLIRHAVKSPLLGHCEPYYTVNLTYLGFTKGEVALARITAEAAAKKAVHQAARKPRAKPLLIECPACSGTGTSTSSHAVRPLLPGTLWRHRRERACLACKGKGKIAGSTSIKTLARRADAKGLTLAFELTPRSADA